MTYEIIKVQEWWANKEKLDSNKIKVKEVQRETEKAIQVLTKEEELFWIPKSLIINEVVPKSQTQFEQDSFKTILKCPDCDQELSEFGRKGYGMLKCNNNKCNNNKLYFEAE